MKEYIRIHERDNVAVALRDYTPGETLSVDGRDIELTEAIGRGHKVALTPIFNGENVIKYGYPIGHATRDIAPGSHVHTHNTKTNLTGVEDYRYTPKIAPNPYSFENRSFEGYKRKDGSVGIRNEACGSCRPWGA